MSTKMTNKKRGAPIKPESEKLVNVTFRVLPEVKEWLIDQGESFTKTINKALGKYKGKK